MERNRARATDDNPYLSIGVRPFINCCGVRTVHGGSVMLPEVKRAMDAASHHFVNLDELMECVGRRLAELTGAAWAIVTSGASAALCHATAACVAGADPEKMLRLPDTRGLKNRVLMTKHGRFTYDHAIRMVGVEVLEVETWGQLSESLDERVAMIAVLGTKAGEGEFRVERLADLAGPRGVPIVVDAASEHLKRPDPYLTRGATMVAYSGGKYLRGPQCTGLLLGEEAWVRAAWMNSAPHHAFGRAMKVGKEEIIGLLAAVEYWAVARHDAIERRQWEADLAEIAREVTRVPSVATEIREAKGPAEPAPRLWISWDARQIGWTGLDLRARLLEEEPRIMLDDRGATDNSLAILPNSLQPGEAKVVGIRLREALATAPTASREARPPAELPQVDGCWDVQVQYIKGSSSQQLELTQRDHELTGVHRTPLFENALAGRLAGHEITFSSLHPFEGTNLAYRFTGNVRGEFMEGTVEVGSSGETAPGPLNQREYGTARWHAKRRG
ncbi:MAG: hypothetical protein ACRELA_17025 [Candidatus Rokuibacteriota bacterium]